ncbi:MAG TPA: AAA family ATPase [Gemmataceae bacterium]|jgi:hypothetical protein|nr:AAA family ATPase [Gemmataceae bacterium]
MLKTRNDNLVSEYMDQLDTAAEPIAVDWLWHGLIARGNITLFTSQWKAGKTTLMTGLLQQFAAGGTFLDRAVTPAKALIVSEESRNTWADRMRRLPTGHHCRLLARPFPRRPTPEQWDELIAMALELHSAGELDLLIIDPLARFLPGSTDSDLNALQQLLDPLQTLTERGVGVTILHHPRKKRSEEGSSARGHGGLLAAVDIIVELSCFGTLQTDERRRKLFCMSRFPATPRKIVYEWTKDGQFVHLGDPQTARFQENWDILHAILATREVSATHQELLMDWPIDLSPPSAPTLYEWLNKAFVQKLLRRSGTGRKKDPYRYRLENEDDKYLDRGEIPPLRDLPFFGNFGYPEPPEPKKRKKKKVEEGAAGEDGLSGASSGHEPPLK